jgi:ribose/xylose/arabinose/galactoside ABC-type transport system permease subunit
MENNDGIKNNNSSPEESQAIRKSSIAKKIFINYGLLIVAVALFFVFSVMQPRFASLRNILNLLSQGSIIGLLALGLTNIVICGEFDISFASVATICSILSVMFVGVYHLPVLLSYLITFIIGVGLEVVNGINVVYIGIPSFIASLGMMSILTGAGKWITKGSILSVQLPKSFGFIGRTKIANVIPSSLIAFLVIAFFVAVFFEITFKGRHFYAVGGNFEAAKRVGISIPKIKFESFIMQGIIASCGGILMGSLFGVGNPEMANSFLFPAIIATFLGAVFLREGIPNIFGTIVATILFSEIANGLIMLGTPLWVKEFVQGAILLVAVTMVSMLKPGGIPGVNIG